MPDTTIMAFKIAERVRLPMMLIMDAFFLSRTAEPVEIPDKELIKICLPDYDPGDMGLDPDNPRTFGSIFMNDVYMKFRWRIQRGMERAKGIITEIQDEFGCLFGRSYHQVEGYRLDDAKVAIVCTGTVASTGRVAIDTLRDKGEKVGMVKIKTLRPFPGEEVVDLLRGERRWRLLTGISPLVPRGSGPGR